MQIEWYAFGLALALLACGDGIGRELVDRQRGGERESSCYEAASCQPVPLDAAPLRGLPPSPAIGLGCADPAATPPHLGSELPLPARCVTWRPPLAGSSVQELRGVQGSELELIVGASEPATLTLAAASLSNSRIVLEGSASLRIIDQSSLRNVQIVSRATVRSFVELVESSADALRIVNEDGEHFAGDVRITRSSLRDCALFTRELALENVSFNRGEIAADELVVHALRGAELKLQIGRAAMASSELTRFELQRCGTMQVTSSLLSFGALAPCEQQLRIDRSDVDDSAIVGRIEGRLTSWQGVSFGAGAATDIELWNSALRSNALCDGIQRFAVQGLVDCNACPVPEIATRACEITTPLRGSEGGDGLGAPVEQTPWNNPDCPALDVAPPCEPQPRDEYPF